MFVERAWFRWLTNRIDGVLFDDYDLAGADFANADANNFQVGDEQGVMP
jgi:hypothetical protein